MFFKQLAVSNIQICMNRYLVSRRFGRSPYSTIFPFWLIDYNLSAWSSPEKLTARKIHAVLILIRRFIGAPCTLIDWFRISKWYFLHWSDGVPKIHRTLEGISWTLVLRRGSTHSKITKTAMFNRRPMGSPILNIFQSNLLQWFYH